MDTTNQTVAKTNITTMIAQCFNTFVLPLARKMVKQDKHFTNIIIIFSIKTLMFGV